MLCIGQLTVKRSKYRRRAKSEKDVASHAASEGTKESIAQRLRESAVAKEHTRHPLVQEVDPEALENHPDHVIADQIHDPSAATTKKDHDLAPGLDL